QLHLGRNHCHDYWVFDGYLSSYQGRQSVKKGKETKSSMTISLIGSGNVATHLAAFFQTHGHEIKQVYNRTADRGRALAKTLCATYAFTLEELDTEQIDLLLIAISDDSIPGVIHKIPEKTKATVVHTAGAAPMSLLSRFEHYGVIYPPQSINKHIPIDLKDVPFAVEGSSENVQTK